jgi:hypothetical protein
VSKCYSCAHYREEEDARGLCVYSDLPMRFKYGCSCYVPVVSEGLFDFNRSNDPFTNEERSALILKHSSKKGKGMSFSGLSLSEKISERFKS